MASFEYEAIVNSNSSDKYIEDVIDARKRIGQYDIQRYSTDVDVSQNSLYKNTYSTPATGISEDFRQILIDDAVVWISEGDLSNYPGEPPVFNVGATDSEITVVRVKQEGLQYKSGENKWNLHDDAVLGDGTYLGESPSLVNLVTLVGQPYPSLESKTCEYKEYMVPISSWDPYDNPYQLTDCLNKPKLHVIKPPNIGGGRLGLAGRISNFLRRRCSKKSKTEMGGELSEID